QPPVPFLMRTTTRSLVVFCLAAAVFAAAPAAQQAPSQARPVFRANMQLVSVDVIVRDGAGNVVRGLTEKDFEVTEDGKPEEIRSFSFQEIKDHPAGIATVDLLGGAKERMAEDMRRAPAAASAAP